MKRINYPFNASAVGGGGEVEREVGGVLVYLFTCLCVCVCVIEAHSSTGRTAGHWEVVIYRTIFKT